VLALIPAYIFGRTVTSNGSPYGTVVLSVCDSLSATLVYCGQTVGWINMPLGMEEGIGPGDIVIDGNPATFHGKGHRSSSLFVPCLLWPNGRPSQQLLNSCRAISTKSHVRLGFSDVL